MIDRVRYLQRQRVENNTCGSLLTHLCTGVKQRRAWAARVGQPPSLPFFSNQTLNCESEKQKTPEIELVREKWQTYLRRWTWKPPPLRRAAALPPPPPPPQQLPQPTRTVGCNPPSSWFSISAIPISEKTHSSNCPRSSVVSLLSRTDCFKFYFLGLSKPKFLVVIFPSRANILNCWVFWCVFFLFRLTLLTVDFFDYQQFWFHFLVLFYMK